MDAANPCAHHAAVGGLVTLADPWAVPGDQQADERSAETINLLG
jgi:hypothetical protein